MSPQHLTKGAQLLNATIGKNDFKLKKISDPPFSIQIIAKSKRVINSTPALFPEFPNGYRIDVGRYFCKFCKSSIGLFEK